MSRVREGAIDRDRAADRKEAPDQQRQPDVQGEQFRSLPDADQANAIPGQPTDNGVSGLMHQDTKYAAEDDAKEGDKKQAPEFGVDVTSTSFQIGNR